MNFQKMLLVTISLHISLSFILCSGYEHEEIIDHPGAENSEQTQNYDDFEPHKFDYDPHESDSEYDEAVLTGTHHHTKKTGEQAKSEIDEIFKKADKNNDKIIDKTELTSYIKENLKKLHNESTHEDFVKIDRNLDNRISLDEYFIHHHGRSAKFAENRTKIDNSTKTLILLKKMQHETTRFKAADSTGDGFLDVDEFLLMKYPVFFPHMAGTVIHDYIADIDTNADGFIDKVEYTNHFHFTDSNNKTREEENLKKLQAEFDEHDKDKNGKINSDEYYAILKPGYDEPARTEMEHLFQETDDNKDGSINHAEVEAHSYFWVGEKLPGGASIHPDEYEDDYDMSHHLDDEL